MTRKSRKRQNTIHNYSLAMARRDLPNRDKKDSKIRGGKCLIVAGSNGMYGASILCGAAAARTGAGYTYLLVTGNFPVIKNPDFLIAAEPIVFEKFSAIAIGPGFNYPKKILSYLKTLRLNGVEKVVLDAEALNVLRDTRVKLLKSWLVTPHEGELARILGVSAEAIRRDRLKYLLVAQKKLGCVVLLKGHRTLIADGSEVWENPTGNPALAKAGTGDVLTGIITSLLSQGLGTLTSAKLGAFIHGYIADQWVKSGRDTLSLLASDMVEKLPEILFQIRKKSVIKDLDRRKIKN